MAIDPNAAATQNSAPVPAQNAPTPSSIPAPDVSAPTNADGTPAAAPPLPAGVAAAPPPTVAPGTNFGANTGDPNAHHSLVGKIFQDVAGGQTTDFVQTDKGPVAVKRDLKPGELARTVLASAFSLMAAGAGGALAAKQHRPFELQPGTSLGEIQNAPVQQRQEQAQKTFENNQTANRDVLLAAKNAAEQQKSYAETKEAAARTHLMDQEYEENGRLNQQKAQDDLVKNTVNYNTALAMPGAEIMTDDKGNELSFDPKTNDAQNYAVQHPDIMHGSKNGSKASLYNVAPVINPYTGRIQFVDYPATRHEYTIPVEYFQARDEKGNLKYDDDGTPVPNDKAPKDPKTGRRTVPTQTVTPEQAAGFQKADIDYQNTVSQIQDREAQARQRDAQWKKDSDLTDAQAMYNNGQIDKMTPEQKQRLATGMFQDLKRVTVQDKSAADRLARAEAHSNAVQETDSEKASNQELQNARKEYNEIHDDYLYRAGAYDELTGNAPGKQLGSKLIHKYNGDNWAAVDKEIKESGLPDTDQQAAKARVWNAMSPAQQAAASGKQTTAPAATGTTTGTAPTPATGKAVIYDPSGKPYQVDAATVDQYLANPAYQGWTKGK